VMASSRNPATPCWIQKRSTSYIALRTAGLFQFRSGCWM
jgi:hypothetical protein